MLSGIPIAFSLIVVSAGTRLIAVGDNVLGQLYGSSYPAVGSLIHAAIPMFVLIGAILERTGIAARLFRVM